jgi:hypothetical protein
MKYDKHDDLRYTMNYGTSVTQLMSRDVQFTSDYFTRYSILEDHLHDLKSRGIINDIQLKEIISQFSLLEYRRNDLVDRMGQTVVVCKGELFFGKDLSEAIEKAKAKFGNNLPTYYSETVNMVDYPTILD